MEQRKTNERLDGVKAKLHIVYEQTGRLSEYHAEITSRFEQMSTMQDLEFFEHKLARHEHEIFKLKRKI